jgi:decaprenylphospho-beta-D-erythro-pentofuranosid-2-ulose 2-reductase
MRRIVVFGATSAIAQGFAREAAARGDALFLVARNPERLSAVAADLRVRGAARVETAVAELAEPAGHEALIAAAEQALAGLDAALVAHGTLTDQAAAERDFSVVEREVATNFLSPASLLTILANRFEARRAGTIVVVSSVAGDRGRGSNYVYGSAKAALTAFASGLRNRLAAAGVAVVTVKPGLVDSPMTAHLPKNALFAASDSVGRRIYRALERREDVVYVPVFWALIMFVIRAIPERFFKRLEL